MIRKALLQENGNGRISPEIRDLLEAFRSRGIPTELFTAKRLQRRQLALAPDVLVAGQIPTVLSALRQLGVEIPEPIDYPPCLAPFLRRRIWESSVRQIRDLLWNDSADPFFAKPKGRMKRFTGRVFEHSGDLYHLRGASEHTPIWCSEVVSWRSEYRTYVIKNNIVGIKHYLGDLNAFIDERMVAEAVDIFGQSGKAPSAYGIDFGVLANGHTALVEANDGFALGSYGLEKDRYADLIVTRWCELTKRATKS